MGIDQMTLSVAKGYVKETVLGGGAVIGKNVTISSITPIDGGNRITFSYTLDNGTVKASTLDVMNGVDGKDGAKGEKGDPGQNGRDGTNGIDGVGISKIEKTKTEGLVDTYIITFSDDSTFEYTVTNGKDDSGSSTGEENVIEEIKVNGVAQAVAEDKSVDITIPTVDVNKDYVDTELAKKANTSDIPSLDGYVTDEELNTKGYLTSHQDISGKVDKVKGKSLIADTEIERLKGVKNYDDTGIKTELAKKANSTDVTKEISDKIAEVVSDAPESFNTLKEISDWISGHENDASAMNSAIKDNKSAITTLQTDKADKTEIPTKVSELENDSSYLTEHQDISNLVVKEKGKGLSSNDYTNEEKDKLGSIGISQGRNLIPYPYYDGSCERFGITWTVNEDGSVTANGTATKECPFNIIYPYTLANSKLFEFQQKYTFSDGIDNEPNAYTQIVRNSSADSTIYNYALSSANGVTSWTASNDDLLRYGIRLIIRDGATVDNVTFKPMLEIGSIAHMYEPTTESNVSLKAAVDGKADKSKVEDVNWTAVDISGASENTSTGATLNYCIKNGICYMSILNIGFKTANQAIILGANSVPKPSSDYCWSPLIGVADPSYSVSVHPNLSGGFEHHAVGLTSQVYSGLFSYPVAES